MKINFIKAGMPLAPIALADLPLGAHAVVVAIEAPPPFVRRLEALGFLPETPVCCRRRAPLGDPRVYELRGTQLCLRRSEAARVRVRRVPSSARPASG